MTFTEAMIEFDAEPAFLRTAEGEFFSEKGVMLALLSGQAESWIEEVGSTETAAAVNAITCAQYIGMDVGEAVLYLKDNYPDIPVQLVGDIVDAAEALEEFRLLNPGTEVEIDGYDDDGPIYKNLMEE